MLPLLLEISTDKAERYLSWWHWKTGEDVRPVAVTTFGDWLFERGDGSVHHLSILDGSVEQVCSKRRQLDDALRGEDARDRFLSETFAIRAWRAGMTLKAGECYSYIVPPVIGGSFEQENVRPFALAGYQLIMYQLTQLVRGVPEGTETNRLEMTFRPDGTLDLLVDGVSVR